MQSVADEARGAFVLIPGAGGMAWYWHRLVPLLGPCKCHDPCPGEKAGVWWQNTRSADSRVATAQTRGYNSTFDVPTYFLHDVPEAVLRTGPARQRDQAESIFEEPCRFERWPGIPIHVIASADDRFFPVEFQQRIARERLGKETLVIPGGHLVALARPDELAEQLLALEGEMR